MFKRLIASMICVCVLVSSIQPAAAQEFNINQLPVPGTMVDVSSPFVPLELKGISINPQKPLEFQFIVDTGSGPRDTAAVKEQTNQLVKYFLAGLTIPEGDLWVNLSPYEKDRMVPPALGETDLGRDLLAQDYILKQLTSSMIYPEKDLGKEFWSRVYKKAQEQFGTTDIPVSTFNKVWILPNESQVFEHGSAAYVTRSTLKVMLDEDYLAAYKNVASMPQETPYGARALSASIVRQIVIPEIEKEVNTGKNFAPLRQIYEAMILAKWYKETIENGLLTAVYNDKNKIKGIDLADPAVKEQIYSRYVQAYKKGAFNYVKESDHSVPGDQASPRKYFSGGLTPMPKRIDRTGDEAMVTKNMVGAIWVIAISLVAAMETKQTVTPATKANISPAIIYNQNRLDAAMMTQALSAFLALPIAQTRITSMSTKEELLYHFRRFYQDYPDVVNLGAGVIGTGLIYLFIYLIWRNFTYSGIFYNDRRLENYISKQPTEKLLTLLSYRDNHLRDTIVRDKAYQILRSQIKDPATQQDKIVQILDAVEKDLLYEGDYKRAQELLELLYDSGDRSRDYVYKPLLVKAVEHTDPEHPGEFIEEPEHYEWGKAPRDSAMIGQKPADQVVKVSSAADYQKAIQQRFIDADTKAKEQFDPGKTSASVVEEEISRNNGNSESFFQHILVNNNSEIRRIYSDVQRIIQEVLGNNVSVLNMDLEQIHVTISNDDVDSKEKLTLTLDQLAEDLRDDVQGIRPFHIQLVGPHLMPNGVVVMEYTTEAPEFLSLRKKAEQRRLKRQLSAQNKAFIPNIIHSTVSVIRDSKVSQSVLERLRVRLDEYRMAQASVDFLVNNITATHFREADRQFIESREIPLVASDKAVIVQNGGIDLNQINVNRAGNKINVQFDPAELNKFMQSDFEGFSPVIIDIKPIQNPLPVLGLSPKKEEMLAKI